MSGTLCADDITLGGGSHLTGSVRSISETGVVEFASDLSPEPLLLKKGTVDKVEFSTKGTAPKPPSTCVELANGDLLPVTLEALDDGKLTVLSPEAGRLEIPRDSLKSLQLGIEQRKVIYAGPNELAEWTSVEGENKNWVFEPNSMTANGPATASKNLRLPQQFILRFTLKWQPKQVPNYQIFFADPLKPKGQPSDRYYLQFGGAGLEIKREAAKGKRYNTIVQLNRDPNQFSGHQLQVELRVDRKNARLQLLLNGEPEGEFGDPIPAVPEGSGIALLFNAQNGNPEEITDIEILELDDSQGRHHAEERGDPKTDSLISREDDRWGGRLMEIRKTDDTQVFIFKSGFQKDLLEIPAADVSTVFFAAKEGKPPEPAVPPFMLRIRGGGALRVSSCQFTEDTVSAVHPLLGKMNFPRQGIVAMERTDAKPTATDRTDAKPKASDRTGPRAKTLKIQPGP